MLINTDRQWPPPRPSLFPTMTPLALASTTVLTASLPMDDNPRHSALDASALARASTFFCLSIFFLYPTSPDDGDDGSGPSLVRR